MVQRPGSSWTKRRANEESRSATIEEYSLLLYIGHVLGAPAMPPVLTPGESCADKHGLVSSA